MFQSYLTQYVCHGIANGRSGCQTEVYDAKGDSQAARSLLSHILSHTCNLECRSLDGFAQDLKAFSPYALQDMVHHTRSAYAYVDDCIILAHSMEGACHEGVVIGGIAQNHQFATSQGVVVLSGLCCFQDYLAHESHGIHIDTCLGAPYVDTAAYSLGGGHRLGNGTYQ